MHVARVCLAWLQDLNAYRDLLTKHKILGAFKTGRILLPVFYNNKHAARTQRDLGYLGFFLI